MNSSELDASDEELIAVATETIQVRYRPDKHTVGAAIRTADGDVFAGVNLRTGVDSAGVHAEPIALGTATVRGVERFETFVAVVHSGTDTGDVQVVPPCGICREMIKDYAPGATVIVPGEEGPVKRSVESLLPITTNTDRWRAGPE